jgi:hypothetical protein
MHRVTHAQTGEVINHRRVRQQVAVRIPIANVAREKRHAIVGQPGQVLALAVHQVVDDDDTGAGVRELADELGADEAGAAGDEGEIAGHEDNA